MPNNDSTSHIFHVAEIHQHEAAALRALKKGEATPDQQQTVLSLIVNKLSRPHDLCYVPGSFDQTGFINGRAFVGQQILKYLNVPVSKLPKLEIEDHNV